MTRRQSVVCSLLFAAGVAVGTPAHAQWSVDFAFGGGGHHHHHHGWHGCYGFYPWPRPYYNYVYVAPPPVVYVPTAPVVQPVVPLTQTPAASTTTAVAATPRSNASPAYNGPGVTIRNPATSDTSLGFVVDNRREVELGSGQTKSLNDKSTYHVEFDRGGDYGTASKNLSEGEYEFTATERGWDLRRVEDSALGGATPTVRRNNLPIAR